MPEPTPDAWAQIRFAYEHTDRPLAHICAEHDITIPMLRYRMKLWDWRRRKPLIAHDGPPAVAVAHDVSPYPPLAGAGRRVERERKPPGWGEGGAPEECAAPEIVAQYHPTPPAFADAAAGEPPPPGEGEENIVPRLQRAVARVLPAIEATLARLTAGPMRPRDMEQAGRALSSLIRALRELNALIAEQQAKAADGDEDADGFPHDIDDFRNELARRINAIVDAREQRAADAGQNLTPKDLLATP